MQYSFLYVCNYPKAFSRVFQFYVWLLSSSSKILQYAFKTGDLSTGNSILVLILPNSHPELKVTSLLPLLLQKFAGAVWWYHLPELFFATTLHWELTCPCLSWQLNPSQGHHNCITTAVWLHHSHFFPRSAGVGGFLIYFDVLKEI